VKKIKQPELAIPAYCHHTNGISSTVSAQASISLRTAFQFKFVILPGEIVRNPGESEAMLVKNPESSVPSVLKNCSVPDNFGECLTPHPTQSEGGCVEVGKTLPMWRLSRLGNKEMRYLVASGHAVRLPNFKDRRE